MKRLVKGEAYCLTGFGIKLKNEKKGEYEMAIYFNTNLPETRGLLAFDRTTSKINDILQRLDTGYRINSGKDDPTGLIKREGMRLDMKGLQSAINNSVAGQNLLTVAEKAMGSIASLLTGDPTDTQDTGIIGLLNDGDVTKITEGINRLANTIDSISRTTVYNGKQVINGAYDYNTSVITTSTNKGTGKVSNVKVTSAGISDGKPVEFELKVDKVAEKAGIRLVTLLAGGTTKVTDGNDYEITLTDAEGVSAKFSVTATSVGITPNMLKSGISTALQNSDIDLELADSGANILQSKSRGENQSVTINVTEKNTGQVINISDFSGVGLGVYDKSDAQNGQVKATGTNWSFSGINGAVVTDGNNVNVYSDSISFSALMDDDNGAKEFKNGDTFNLKVSGGTSFQLGKDVSSVNRFNLGIATINSNNLVAKDGTTLADLRTLDYKEKDNVIKAQNAIADFATQIATERGRLGTIQKNVLVTNQYNLEDQLAIVTAEEAAISNTDVALETSRLSRQELIAESAMNVISYARSFSQFAVSSLFQ
ncbi:MAG: hypothetical protein LBK06_04155 [Planctomycetaceae bacterium]|nr:hypothetical protein [Planctomycetaceae bacterium]